MIEAGQARQSGLEVFGYALAVGIPFVIFAVNIGMDITEMPHTPEGQCPVGAFPCNDNVSDKTCVRQVEWCDSVPHCPNEEDEDFTACQDQHSFVGSFFTCIPAFTEYGVGCELEGTFPSHCDCSMGTSLTCENVSLSSFPAGIPSNTTDLTIGRSGLVSIDSNDIGHLEHLIVLDLSGNSLQTIEGQSFSNLTFINRLLLSFNKLTVIEKTTFSGLSHLSWLLLNANRINHIENGAFDETPNLCLLTLNGNELTLNEAFPSLSSVRFLDLQLNKIETLRNETLRNVSSVISLLMADNKISVIESRAFSSLNLLTELDLARNKVETLDAGIFENVIDLRELANDISSLADNPLSYIPAGTFDNLVQLKSLDLTGLKLRQMNPKLFSVLPELKFIYFDSFDKCRFAPQVRVCEPKGDGISSFTDLLGSPVLRACVWIVGLTTCLANLIVLFFRMLFHETRSVPSLFVKNLAVCDYLMGLYLISVGTHDQLYRGFYYRHALAWVSSWQCQLGGLVAMISSEVSILILTVMSVERLAAITMPFKCPGLDLKAASVLVVCLWILGLIVSMIPVIPGMPSLDEFYSSNGVCFPLHIHDPYLPGWEYSAVIFLGINGAAMVIVIVAYLTMFLSLRRSQAYCAGSRTDVSFAKRFFLIVLTDAMCWIPLIIIKILALLSIHISDVFYGWLVVFVLPVNSALNPIVYSLSTPTFQRQFSDVIPNNIKASISQLMPRRFSALSQTATVVSDDASD